MSQRLLLNAGWIHCLYDVPPSSVSTALSPSLFLVITCSHEFYAVMLVAEGFQAPNLRVETQAKQVRR